MSSFVHRASDNSKCVLAWRFFAAAFSNSALYRLLCAIDRLISAAPDSSKIVCWLRRDWHEQHAFSHSVFGKIASSLGTRLKPLAQRCSALLRAAVESSAVVALVTGVGTYASRLTSASYSAAIASEATALTASYAPSLPGVALALFAFILPFTPTSVNTLFALTLLALVLLCKVYHGEFKIDFARSYVPMLLLFGAACAATISSATIRGSMPALILWASYAVVFFVSSQVVRKDSDLWFIALCWLASSVLVSLAGFVQYLSGIETAAAWVDARAADLIRTRVFSVFDNPNMLAEYLSYAVTLGISMILAARHHLERMLYSLSVLVSGLCLVLTFSRGGWIAVAVGVVVLGFLKDRRILILLFGLLLLMPLFASEAVLQRAETIVTLDDSSALYRLTIWRAAARMVRDYWLTGVGLGIAAFSKIYPLYEIAGTPAMHSHNLYLQIAVEMGIMGVLMFAFVMLNHARDALSGRVVGRSSFVMLGLFAATCGQLVHGLIDNIWYSPKNVMFFWLAVGLTVGASMLRSKETQDA